jgi:hypothetical protein
LTGFFVDDIILGLDLYGISSICPRRFMLVDGLADGMGWRMVFS